MSVRNNLSPAALVKLAAGAVFKDFNNQTNLDGVQPDKADSYRLKSLGGSSKVQSFAIHFLDKHGTKIGDQYLGNFISS
jgi:hypothetical protein